VNRFSPNGIYVGRWFSKTKVENILDFIAFIFILKNKEYIKMLY
jgi:hypothetical protein